MSAYLFVAVGGGSIGLLVGGILTQAVSWHWIFIINVPIGILTLILGSALITENQGLGVRHGLDVAGSLLMTLSLMIGIYAIVTVLHLRVAVGSHAGLRPRGLPCAHHDVLFTVEARVPKSPIMPLRVLQLKSLTASSVVRGLTFSSMFAVFFFGALYMERVLGYGPLKTGVAFLPMSLSAWRRCRWGPRAGSWCATAR